MFWLLFFCTVLCVIFCVVPLSRHPHWIVRAMDFPRLQIALFLIFLVIADVVFLDFNLGSSWTLLLTSMVCLSWQLWWILPYTPLWKKEVKTARDHRPDSEVSILTANVLTPNRNAEALIELVREHKPDVLVTLESDQWWQDQLVELSDEMGYRIKCPLDNLYGMHVFSRFPLEDPTISFLIEEDVPSIHALLVLPTGDKIRVHFLHPAPPSPTENEESTERDAELVIVGRSVAESDLPIIVTGDLNDVAWSATTRLFRKISGLLDPRVGRGMFNTFHVDYFFLRWPLDHLFHSEHFTLKSIQRLPSIGSDHFSLLTRLVYNPAYGSNQEGLEADVADRQWAQDINQQQESNKNDVPSFRD
uniref:Endonuclease n=2 Tax=Vibrio algicola TaxID=2662262 RepID=A0A5Q0TI14_9VIBR